MIVLLSTLFKVSLIGLSLFWSGFAQAARPVIEIRSGYGFLQPNYGYYGGSYSGLLPVELDLKVNLFQPYLSLMIPALFEVLLGRMSPSAYSGYGGLGLKIEPWPRILGRPFISAAGLYGYGSDGATEYGMGVSAFAEAGIAIGKVTGLSIMASYRLRWTQTGVWLGMVHEVLGGITFPLGR